MKYNKGYTLIEMIIVIAIMAIMSGFAVVTFGIVRKAKCNAAIDTFNNQLTSIAIKTKSLSQSKDQNPADAIDSSNMASLYPLCLMVRRNDPNYSGSTPYPPYDPDSRKKNAYIMYMGYYDSSNNFVVKEEVGILPRVIEIDYDKASIDQLHALDNDGSDNEIDKKYNSSSSNTDIDTFFIQFNKSDGSVKYGAGKYEFYVNGSKYGEVVLNSATGNHYTK